MKKIRYAGMASLLLMLSALGCVIRTEHRIDAHIRLDIRHIQDQAEQLLDFVEGKSDTLPGFEEAAMDATEETTSWLLRSWNLINPMPVAHASELRSSSPRVREIAESLRQNHEAISALKQQGCLGENNRGFVELRDCDALSEPAKRNEAQQLLAEENKHRKALYQEVARLNQEDNVTVATVEQVYAIERLRRARPGEIVQLPKEGKAFDEVKDSDLGRKLGDKLQPNAWVSIP